MTERRGYHQNDFGEISKELKVLKRFNQPCDFGKVIEEKIGQLQLDEILGSRSSVRRKVAEELEIEYTYIIEMLQISEAKQLLFITPYVLKKLATFLFDDPTYLYDVYARETGDLPLDIKEYLINNDVIAIIEDMVKDQSNGFSMIRQVEDYSSYYSKKCNHKTLITEISIPQLIQLKRLEKKITLRQLFEMTDITNVFLNRLEANQCPFTVKVLTKICPILFDNPEYIYELYQKQNPDFSLPIKQFFSSSNVIEHFRILMKNHPDAIILREYVKPLLGQKSK